MKTKLMAVMVLFSAWAVMATAQGEDSAKELESLKGTWKLVSEVASGQNIPADPMEIFIFTGDNVVNKVGPKVTDEFTIKVNPTKTPKEIDLIPLKDPNKGVSCPGIYKVEKNELTICVNFNANAKRPTAFESTNTNGNIILTMKKG
jgi:uncharacterized protein (TIGR03067 family)